MSDTQAAPRVQAGSATNRWIADIRKNSREIVRIELSAFKSADLVNCRVWFEAGNGEMRPGREGFALKIEKLPELKAAIDKALEAARVDGLIR